MSANFLDVFTKQALTCFGHEGSEEHYKRLSDTGKLCGTQCNGCQSLSFPPRSFCPDCYSDDVSYEEIGEGARLYAFTTQQRALRFMTPHVIGVVEIPAVGFVVAPIAGSMDELEIGQSLKQTVVELGDGLIIHQFVPA